ncbi:hypothetical protein VQ7734_02795 [Vibrio quintilis]|uniref:Uncharacterized protein n=1 Tax=Vibrio quintilis TaxID=1117707 RepID=A0A1M7YX05_9VIBR|nr:hypothetical protein VQ7734_02795 [Vibrio quintilis]
MDLTLFVAVLKLLCYNILKITCSRYRKMIQSIFSGSGIMRSSHSILTLSGLARAGLASVLILLLWLAIHWAVLLP